MRRFFHLMIVAVAAVCMVAGCEKYDDSELRKELQELREKLASLEAWCSSSQSAIDAVAVLQEVVNNMNSVENIEPFIDADGATGFVITFTNEKTIKLYNGQNGKDGDTFFGSVVVNDDCIIFTLADGRTFTVPRKQDEHNYLAFEAVEAGATVSMEIVGTLEAPSLEYSTNKLDWTTFDFGAPQTITLKNVGDKVYWRNTGKAESFSKDNNNYVHFVLGEQKVAAKGNIMSLVDNSCQSRTIPAEWCFIKLFLDAASLEKAPELPAMKLALHCYRSMFSGCTSLKMAPALPSKELAEGCYYAMFMGCSSLESAPELPATTLSIACYYGMFAYCESLKEAPALPATELPDYCYSGMFQLCHSITEAPDIIPATKVGYGSCFSMFDGCASLKKAPILPAMQLDEYCYQQMFANCTSLEEAPELPATELATACYSMMFTSCTSLKEAPALPALKMEEQSYACMFQGCESLETAPELPATELAPGCYNAMFLLCTSLKNAPELTATKLEPYCYYELFAGCESLADAPELPATELVEGCYWSMFQECSSLETAPELPAEQLYNACYVDMFALCTSLTKAPELPAKELFYGCYSEMFWGCSSLKEAPELPATDLALECYSGMFYGCSSLTDIKVAFTDWREDIDATTGWVEGVGAEGTFECPESLAIQYGDSYIPNGWSVNGDVPVAAKSLAVPAKCSSVEKPTNAKHARRAMLKPELTEPEMIRL